jgi:hypothetical protein
MPQLWAKLECGERELSTGFHQAVLRQREQFKLLGFSEQGFKKLGRTLDPSHRDSGGVNFLDSRRCHWGQLIYLKYFLRARPAEIERITIAFTAVFENDVLSCTNAPKTPFDDLPNHQVVRMESDEVAQIYERFVQLLGQRTDPPRHFPNLPALKAWSDANALEILAHRVRAGCYMRMTNFEVAAARRKLPPAVASP